MEDWLKKILRRTNNKFVRISITIIILFLILAGLVTIFDALGFGAEIAKYRRQILPVLIILSIIGVLIQEVVKSSQTISNLTNQIKLNKDQLDEAKQQEESILRLMEKYKRSAFTELLENVDRLLILAIKRDEWRTNQARVTKVRIKQYSAAESIDPEFARKERIEIIINIGKKAGVSEGMEFLVMDPQIPLDYGLVSVIKVFPDGAICALVEELDYSFWEPIHELPTKHTSKMIEVPDNRIIPYLPTAFDAITPESAENLRTIISKIVYNQHIK